ncbi:hypothetical protein FACS189461_3780 [Spirochaetia bacterium]|nr:hypothetical protein FACS189461_3780 [Spirochaetia bacterium]
MDSGFITIIQKLIAEQGKETLLSAAKCKGLLADYTEGEYKKESRLLLQAVEAGTAKAINNTQELQICKQQQSHVLFDDYFVAEAAAAEVVDMLAFVLRGDKNKVELNDKTSKENAEREKNGAQEAKEKAAASRYPSPPPYVLSSRYTVSSSSPAEREAREKAEQVAKAKAVQDAESHFTKGKSFNDKKDWDNAIAEYTKAIKLNPNKAEYYKSRGDVYRLSGDNVDEDLVGIDAMDRAIADYTQAIKHNPNDADSKEQIGYCHYSRGNSYIGKRDYDGAIAEFSQAIKIDPSSGFSYGGRGRAYYKRGIAYNEQRGFFEKIFLTDKKDYKSAIADLKQAIKLRPDMKKYWKEDLANARLRKEGYLNGPEE